MSLVKTSSLAVILAALIISVTFMGEADGAGLVWRAVNKLGSLVSDLGDVAGGCSNGEVMKYQTSNSTWICGTDSTGSGFTNIAKTNTANTTSVLADNSTITNRATFKSLSQGTGIQLTNNANDIVIASTVVDTDTDTTNISQISTTNSTIIADNSTSTNNVRLKGIAAGSGIAVHNGTNTITIFNTGALTDTTGFTNIASELVTASNATLIADNSTVANRASFKTISEGTGIDLTTNAQNIIIASSGYTNIANSNTGNATLIENNSTANRLSLKTLSAGLGMTLTQDANNIVLNVTSPHNILSGNLTHSNAGSNYQQIWRIPLTSNSGNIVNGMIIARSLVANVAPQFTANVTDNNITGMCNFHNPLTISTESIDNLILNNTGTLVVMTDTAETTTFPNTGINGTIIDFECGMIVGNVNGDLRLFFQSEVEGSAVEIKAGSYYDHSP